jgi:hypothetical protein
MENHQDKLFNPRFSGPLEFGSDQYVPILKSMSGERTALREMREDDPVVGARVTPLIEARDHRPLPIEPTQDEPGTDDFPEEAEEEDEDREPYNLALELDHMEPKPRTSKKPRTPPEYLRNLPTQLLEAVGPFRPFYLDFPLTASDQMLRLRSNVKLPEVNAIEYVYAACREKDLWFIPVLDGSRADSGRPALVRRVMRTAWRGVCLRLKATGTFYEDRIPGTIGLGRRVAAMKAALEVESKDVDLLLELGYLEEGSGVTADTIARVMAEVDGLDRFRSVIVAGTVIPNTTAGWPLNAVTVLPRLEWQLWSDLRRRRDLRPVTYGDYGVQHPQGPITNGRARANVRYTTPETVVYSLGAGTIAKAGLDQYQPVCQRIVDSGQFRGPAYTWGDDIIGGTADRRIPPKGEPQWRGAGTSHHLKQVVQDLVAQSLPPAP